MSTKSVSFFLLLPVLLFTGCISNSEKSLEKQELEKVQSMLEIQNTIAAYAMAWDYEKTENFINHFHKDAVIIDSWHNKEIKKFNGVKEFMDARGSENGNVGGHTLSMVHFKELTESTASTEVIFNYFWYGSFINSNASVNIRGKYIDDWVKTEIGWRIIKRIIEHENVPPHRAEQFGMTE